MTSTGKQDLNLTYLDEPLAPQVFLERLYDGEIFVLRGLPEMHALRSYASTLMKKELEPHEPSRIHEVLGHAEQVERFGALRKTFSNDPSIKALWTDLFTALGFDVEKLARDRLILRFQPHHADAQRVAGDRATAPLQFHRDTWGSNIYSQINWWAPVTPLSPLNTMEIYPELWSRAVANSSASYDVASLIARSRQAGGNAVSASEVVPSVLEELSDEVRVAILIEPGELLVFSAAHAHASVVNTSGVTRISIETRTVWIDDLLAERGAPNVDGDAPWSTPGWFRRVSDGSKLTEVLQIDELRPYSPPRR